MKKFVFAGLLSCAIAQVWCDADSPNEKIDKLKTGQSWVADVIKNQPDWRNVAGDWRSFCLERQSDVQAASEGLNVQQYVEDSFVKGAIKGARNALVSGGLVALPVLRTRLAAPFFFCGAALSAGYTFAKCGYIDEPHAQRMSYYAQFDPKKAERLSHRSEAEQERYMNGQITGGLALTGLLVSRMLRQAPRIVRAILLGAAR